MLNAGFLLISWFVPTLSAEIAKGPSFVPITSNEVERPNSREIFKKVKEPEYRKEYESPSFSDDDPLKVHVRSRRGYPDYEYEDLNVQLPSRIGYPDYEYEDLNAKESSEFKKKWHRIGVMKISYIGWFDPNYDEDERRRRDIGWKTNTLPKRGMRKDFSRTEGCNQLPVAPANSFGICHHNSDIGKCWVRCHTFSRYPNDMKQRTLLCLDGLWQPKKLPDCVPQTPCEERQISGNNMRISCILEEEKTMCTGTCEDGFTFPDNETVKKVECEELDGELVTPTKFPDCSFSGYGGPTNSTEEPTNDTWIYF